MTARRAIVPTHGVGRVPVPAELRERVRRILAHGHAHARRECRTEDVELLHRIADLGLARPSVIERLSRVLGVP